MVTLERDTIRNKNDWPEQGQWTYDDWLQLPDNGTRFEIIDGTLHMSPPPSAAHQFTSAHLFAAIYQHVHTHDLGHVACAPIGVRLPNQSVPLQPDIVFIAKEHAHIIGRQYIEGVPDLVVEILSPSNWPYDRNEKFKVYQDAGVPECWLLDYRAKTAEPFLLEDGEYVLHQGILTIGDVVHAHVLTGFQIAVADIFRDVK